MASHFFGHNGSPRKIFVQFFLRMASHFFGHDDSPSKLPVPSHDYHQSAVGRGTFKPDLNTGTFDLKTGTFESQPPQVMFSCPSACTLTA